MPAIVSQTILPAAGASPIPERRFTVDGSAALEARLAAICERVEEGVRALIPANRLQGLLLAGGYGRGEGGVLKQDDADQPYNDMEFYVLVRGNAVLGEREFRGALAHLGESLAPVAGLEVEFKVLTLDKLRNSPSSMFYYDLVSGHRWQIGYEALLSGCEHHLDSSLIPLHEGTRLLMNRCSGLLFSAERLSREHFGPREADYVGRNLAKARLALGDVVLVAHRRYHWSCLERKRRLLDLDGPPGLPWSELTRAHASGVEFKLHPNRSVESREPLAASHAAVSALARQVWFWLEEQRLQGRFKTPRDYAQTPANLCAELSTWRNPLLDLSALGLTGLPGWRYPRERLLRSLPLLLWDREGWPIAASKLKAETAEFAGLVAAYERLWRRFN